MNSIFFIALRRLRAPLILIILIFAVATVGLTVIPGVDAEGRPWHMSLFQALYLVSYTATTIGFGEIPHPFTDTQRLWVTFVIYLSVIGWAYLVSALLALAQDQGVRQSIVTARFGREVRRLREPFYVVCGFGETGLMVVRTLDRLGFRFVVIDADATRLHELELQELTVDTLGIAADARHPDTLTMAGILKAECRGVLALSNSDEINLTIALAVHLLHPGLPILCRSHTPSVDATLELLDNCQVIDPFDEFAQRLLLAMKSPDSHRLLTWLTDPPGTYLRPRIPTPPGAWIVCGYGRFGAQLASAIESGGFDVVVIDPAAEPGSGKRVVSGLGSDRDALLAAGVSNAAGLVAGTDSDPANLAITITARQLNPDLFIIARQNFVANEALFASLRANMTMVASQIIANECVATLRTPLLANFLAIVEKRPNEWAEAVVQRLSRITQDIAPDFWSISITPEETPGLLDAAAREGVQLRLGELMRRSSDRTARAATMPLLLSRLNTIIELPSDDTVIEVGDRLLFAGTGVAAVEQRELVRNANIAAYVLTGRSVLGGYVWQWLARRRQAA